MNALDPIRHAYGEAGGAPPSPGEPGHAEYALLRSTRDALDALPRQRPDASVLDAVTAAAHARAHQPLQAAYGEAEPPTADDPRHAEFVLLKDARAALDGLPRPRPDAEVLGVIAAAVKVQAQQPLLAAYGEAEPPAPGTPRHAEYALLDGAREALDRLPTRRPDVSVLDAVTAAARAATVLGPLRHAYGEAEDAPPAIGAPGHTEYALLKGTREVLDRLPKPRPDASVLDAVKAAAQGQAHLPLLAAYGEAEAPAPGTPRHAEYALLDGAREVLDRAPRARPDAAVLASVVAVAAEAVGAAAVPAAPALRPVARRPAAGEGARPADRPARERVRPLRRLPAWIGTAAVLVIVATAGIWMLNEPPPELSTTEPTQAVPDGAEPESSVGPDGAAADVLAPSVPNEAQPAEGLVAEATPPVAARPSRAQARGQGASETEAATPTPRPVASPRALPPPPPVPAPAAAAGRPEGGRVGFAAEEAVTPASSWETAADVRLLSLRLQQMAETSEGLSWDTPPMPFGAPSLTPGSRLEGVQSVRDGAAPAHIEVRMRTPPSDRSDGQQPRP